MRRNRSGRRYFATPELRKSIHRQGRINAWVAAQIDVTPGHFSHVLRGRRDVAEADAKMIAAILGDDFFSLWKLSDDTDSASDDVHIEDRIAS